MIGPDAVIGATARTPADAQAAAADGVDYLGVGPIYESVTKPGRTPLGVEAVRRIRKAISLPIVGISGIAPGRARTVVEAGAAGVAVISGVLRADDPVRAAKVLYKEVQTAKRRSLSRLA